MGTYAHDRYGRRSIGCAADRSQLITSWLKSSTVIPANALSTAGASRRRSPSSP